MEDVDEDEDEEEVVVLGDAGCAVMRAVAGLRAAASSAATTGRMEGMSSGCRLGVGGWGDAPVTGRPGGPIWSAAVGEGGAGLRSSPSGLGWVWVLQCVRSCGLASAGADSSRGLHSGAGGLGLGFLGCVQEACAGYWAGWACCGAWGSLRLVCAGCRVWGVVRGGSSSRSRRPPDRSILGQKAEGAQDCIVRGRRRRSGHNPQDRIIRAQVAKRPGQDRPGRNKQQQPPAPGQVRKQLKRQCRGGTVTQGRRPG